MLAKFFSQYPSHSVTDRRFMQLAHTNTQSQLYSRNTYPFLLVLATCVCYANMELSIRPELRTVLTGKSKKIRERSKKEEEEEAQAEKK